MRDAISAFLRDERGMEIAQAVLLLIGGVLLVHQAVTKLGQKVESKLLETESALS